MPLICLINNLLNSAQCPLLMESLLVRLKWCFVFLSVRLFNNCYSWSPQEMLCGNKTLLLLDWRPSSHSFVSLLLITDLAAKSNLNIQCDTKFNAEKYLNSLVSNAQLSEERDCNLDIRLRTEKKKNCRYSDYETIAEKQCFIIISVKISPSVILELTG